MTVKWATARDVSATLKAVTCTGMCTTLQTQLLPLNLAHFLIYVAPISCISLQKVTLYFEKLASTESNFELFTKIHLMISLQHKFDYTFPLHFSLVCALKIATRGFLLPLGPNKDQNAMFCPNLPPPYCMFIVWAEVIAVISISFTWIKNWKIWGEYLQCKSPSPSLTQPWKAQVN